VSPAQYVEPEWQRRYCLAASYTTCSIYTSAQERGSPAPSSRLGEASAPLGAAINAARAAGGVGEVPMEEKKPSYARFSPRREPQPEPPPEGGDEGGGGDLLGRILPFAILVLVVLVLIGAFLIARSFLGGGQATPQTVTPIVKPTPLPTLSPTVVRPPVPGITPITPLATPTPTLIPVLPPAITVQGIILATSNVRLRADPSTTSTVLASIPPGATVEVLDQNVTGERYSLTGFGTSEVWYKVAYQGQTGYIWSPLIKIRQP